MKHDSHFVALLTAPVEHGLVLVEAPNSSYRHDDWDPRRELVSAGPDSLYLSVRPSVDGPVEIGVMRKVNEAIDTDGLIYYDGFLESPRGVFIIHDADDLFTISVMGKRGRNRLKVIVDQEGLVSKMLIAFME